MTDLIAPAHPRARRGRLTAATVAFLVAGAMFACTPGTQTLRYLIGE